MKRTISLLLLALLPILVYSQEKKDMDSLYPGKIEYGIYKGFQFQTQDNRFLLQIQSRLQFRFSTPSDSDPVSFDEFDTENSSVFKINRARLKVGGHAYEPWLKYYWEYELSQSNLMDFKIMVEKWDWLKFKVGQWKIEYSQERRISSGEQQMIDRSIINRPFTLDRQQGMELYGHLGGAGLLDFNYWAAALTGTGRGIRENDDKNLMYFGRVQWNVLGEHLGFEGSDLEVHEKPSAFIAIAGVTNRSSYTRFSQAGGGSLLGYENGEKGQYRVNQYNIETAFKYKGFSWQSEFHHKEIIDKLDDNAATHLRGYYLQGGYLFHQSISWWPSPLEFAVRYSNYQPDKTINEYEEEQSVAFNWFFKEHKNKLTAEISHFDYSQSESLKGDKWRFRIQWDISF